MNAPVTLPLKLPQGLRDPHRLVSSILARLLQPEPELTVSTWADQHRRLSSKASSEPGQWQTARTPYLREIMDALTPSHPCTDAAFVKGTQLGGSEALYNGIGYIADQVPCPVMLVMPTTDTAKRVSKQRLQPMVDETPALAARFSEAKGRASSNTVLMKDFAGGVLVITGANSGPGLRSMPVRMLLMDEVDAYPDDVDGEGDPCAVAEKRTDTYSRAKRVACSTPKIRGKSRIDRRYLSGTQGRYHVPCPHCAHEQWLKWAQMRWTLHARHELVCSDCGGVSEVDPGPETHRCAHCHADVRATDASVRRAATEEIDRVWYECEACGAEIREHHKTAMLERGRHIHDAPGVGEVLADDDPDPHAIWARVRSRVVRFLPNWARPLSWHVSALYSPLGWFGWHKAVRQYLDAQKGGDDPETGESLEQVFVNTVLGEAYEVRGEQPECHLLKQNVEAYDLGTVPLGGLLLTAFVDVQGDRIEVEVDAFGEGEECWLVDHQVIHGDPSQHGAGSVWEAAIALRDKAYPHAGGSSVRITAMGVDSGYLTQDVYAFCRQWAHKHVIATKGDDGSAGRPVLSRPVQVDINHRGQRVKHGVQLWRIGTGTSKERLFRRLAQQHPEGWSGEPIPGYQHFPRGLPDEYFDQLTAERLIRRRTRGVEKLEWVKTRERNEALDLKIGCYAVAVYAGVTRMNWAHLRSVIVPPAQADMFVSQPAPVAAAPPPASAVEDKREPAASGFFNARTRETPPRSGWIPRRDNWMSRP